MSTGLAAPRTTTGTSRTAAGTGTLPGTGPAVRLEAVSKAYGPAGARNLVLDEISLDVAPGEFVCLLGASGCGKSTLLNLVAGLDRPSAGQVRVAAGRPALMFQDHALFPWLSAGRNIELALRLAGVPRSGRRERAEELLELVHLPGAYGKRVHQLSGGMRQRVALARSLAQGSDVLLMDEPFAALDAITRDLLHEELTRLWQERQFTVLFVTHNVREAVRLGQRVVLLSSRPGRIAREWRVELPCPRRIEDGGVASLATEITGHLHQEIVRHART
ncbi:ABC transporter ATP-binding protein [Streptomyces aidingensis]|uniref:NitT/TauT family transport system ATP-binding protein n=1 Tax=Streptomyces aidingensis TaxID=910347 RepID=A0A1I1IQM0_9ACTN|nr:ABC transporter ATP-binding protein [Streptomyces aidingensis]SFC37982.1 NitT/TauT family transport system ATP-binding protein [Streptomyces aidingensis]